jgi:RimJ/RimL family protein N-acetyltransferase
VRLRRARTDDLEFIVAQEARPEFRHLIGSWDAATHASNLRHANIEYWIVEDAGGRSDGFVILSGLQSPHRAIELTRIVMREPGRGHGREVCRQVLSYVFDVLHAHRLSLDVFETNERAAALYASLGFQREGLMREAFRRDDGYCSLILMSMLETEYRAAHAGVTT